jgi:hypothetical protein
MMPSAFVPKNRASPVETWSAMIAYPGADAPAASPLHVAGAPARGVPAMLNS